MRVSGVVVGLVAVALVVAYLSFGLPALVVGAPILLGVILLLGVVVLVENSRRTLAERKVGQETVRRSTRPVPAPPVPQRGLMSGFFEISRTVRPPRA